MSLGVKTFARKLVDYMESTASTFEDVSKKAKERAKQETEDEALATMEASREDMTIARVLRVLSRIISNVAEV